MLKLFLSSYLILLLNIHLVAQEIVIPSEEVSNIASKIWINEGAGQDKYLIHWNKGEEFASIGIGHFIWFTKEKPMWFFEAFPAMLRFIVKEGAKLPVWLTPESKCIWNNYNEWKIAKKNKSKRYLELLNFMNKTKDLQAKFMIHRLNKSFVKILHSANTKKEKNHIKNNFNRLLYNKNGKISPQGVYILVDYTNFKGDGTLDTARYQGKGWGLLQVLTYMNPKDSYQYRAFAKAAQYILERLIRLSPPKRNLKRFKKGWTKRVNTYYKI